MANTANEGKSLAVEVNGARYVRIPVKTHVITDKDTVADVLIKYVKPLVQDGDIVFMSEKAVACTQKRAIKMSDIHPRPLAKFLSRFVYKTPYGIGLGIPETMEMALRECGTPRILFAAVISVIGKLFGKRGWFYMVAGDKARSIDGPCDYTLPPYNEYVVLGPLDPEQAARDAASAAGIPLFAIVDLNDLGGNILGVSSPSLETEHLLQILKDNPLGQTNEQTPIGIIREIAEGADIDESGQEDENTARRWFEKNFDNIVEDLRRIVKIRSVSDENSDVKPFGQGCRDVLDEMLKICEEHGIEAVNHDYYCGSAYLKGTGENGEKEIGIWTHLDVVPESGEWIYPPYEGQLADDFMIGRGVADNKSAAILGLYILKYFRENEIPLNASLRVFFGCHEECGMNDEAYYIERNRLPDYSLIPDSEFPVCYSEKGILEIDLVSPAFSDAILSLNAGLVKNMVADKAVIRIKKTPEILEKLTSLTDVSVHGDSVEIKAYGQASHAAHPENSLNAIGVLARQLVENKLLSEADEKAFSFIMGVCEDYTGESLGINVSSGEFEDLTCIAGKLELDGRKAVLNINIRYPYGENGGMLAAVIKARCIENGFTTANMEDSESCCVPKDSDFVKALMSAFTEVTGMDDQPFVMGGGTYARHLPNAVAFGQVLPGDKRKKPDLPEGHGDIHKPDEALNLGEFIDALEIYAKAVKNLDALP